MKDSLQITGAIVLYKESEKELTKTINSFLRIKGSKKLYLIDNSPTDLIKNKFNRPDIEYIFNNSNLGFGRAHNIILDKIDKISSHHLILNPDVEFSPEVISTLIKVLDDENNVAMIAPKVIFPTGEHQYSCRRYPSLFELIIRRLTGIKRLFHSLIKKGEYREKDLSRPFFPDFIHGCFHLYKTEDFVKIGGFDERYFLYMEDVDICRKIDQIGMKKLYYPKVHITHTLKKGSSKNPRLFLTHLWSSIKYFKKWGF